MSTNLLRCSEICGVLKTSQYADDADRAYEAARIAAHSFPRRNATIRNSFRKLRKMARSAGVWESVSEPNDDQYLEVTPK